MDTVSRNNTFIASSSSTSLHEKNAIYNLASDWTLHSEYSIRPDTLTMRLHSKANITQIRDKENIYKQQPQQKQSVNQKSPPLTAAAAETVVLANNRDPHRVRWVIDDPQNPQNWSLVYKCWLTFQIGMLSMAASLGTAITSPAANAIADDFGVSHELIILNVSLYLLGFAFGPVLWAPMSEVWGRRVSLIPPMIGLALLSVGVGASPGPASLFVCRFFSGVFGSAPVSNVSAALGDIWSAKARGTATAVYALAVVGGPTIGPVVGSALNATLGWRWTGYILAIWVATFTLLSAVFFPETYAPLLLKRRAKKMRKDSRDARWHHPHETIKLDPRSILVKHLARPIRMLLTEPIVTALAFYAAFVYALQFVSLEIFPYVYGELRGWSPVAATLPFLALFVGEFGAMAVCLGNQPRAIRHIEANGGRPAPEARIPPMVLGGLLFVAGLFWFGWTAGPNVPWESSVVSAIFLGAGFDIIFQQAINVLVDIYQQYAASAVSANTLLRSLLAAGLPLASGPMVTNLGVGPAMSILGGVAALALPIPFLLMKYGPAMRRKSKFAPYDED
ncbi:hypothetical protein MMC10_010891 [Thelotrema lepadinum]|nr:hypothetical protein [Thelotrema lepadinum]